MKIRTLLVLTVALACMSLASAQELTGSWKGKVSVDLSKVPAPKGAEGKKMMNQMKSFLSKMVISLKLNTNKTYIVSASGIPGSDKAQTSEGTWKLTGKNIVLTPTKDNGKKATGEGAKPQTLTVSGDKRKLMMPFPGAAGMAGSITFTR